MRYWNRIWESIERQKENEAQPAEEENASLPTIWLLGKTGAGKSSFIKLLTGIPEIEIGNGYEPCTRHSCLFKFPADEPVAQFVDTAGIGMEKFDPADGIASQTGPGNAIIAVVRIDDPVVGDLCAVIRNIRKLRRRIRIIVVHSRADEISDSECREQLRNANHRSIELAAGQRLPQVEMGLNDQSVVDNSRKRILDLLEDELPLVAFLMEREERSTVERAKFSQVRSRVARRSLEAGTAAAIPIVGIPAEVAVQARMLIELSRQYDVPMSREVLVGMGSALGVGIVAGRAVGMIARQAGTLIPIVGQTAGPAIAGVTGFASTFAMGRASGYYFHQLKAGTPPDRNEIRRLYRSALRNAQHSYKSGR